MSAVYLFGRRFQKKCQSSIEPSGHFHCMLKTISSGIVNMQKLPLDFFSVWHCMNTGIFARKISCLQDGGSVASGKTDPGVFPWVFGVCTVDNLSIRIN